MRLREWKYEDGEFTYAQRIELAEVFKNDSLSEYQKMKAAWRVLYGWSARWMNPWRRVKAFGRMLNGLLFWVKLERKNLKYEPTPEELRAGLQRLNEQVGEMVTIKALAEKFGVDPDVILTWHWAKAYGLLYADLKEAEYQRRMLDQIKHRK